jgi:peptidoglycan/xylan/chitin deacetylase (PgdA/CDA1 family)
MRRFLIGGALGALSLAQIGRWLPRPRDAAGIVVTLHHVEPARGGSFRPNAHLSVTPDFLDRFVRRMKARGRRFVSVAELLAAPRNGKDAGRIAVTLDDGFRDNSVHALPVFRRHEVPFTLYVCPGFCDRTAELWWEALERIVATHDELPAPGEALSGRIGAGSVDEKRRAFAAWAHWLTAVADERLQRQAIRALAQHCSLDLAALARELVMDWDEVRALARDPLCTIGAHTMTHPALARLPAAEALREMQESAERIDREIGMRPQTLAFPYGYAAAASAREAELARQAGFAASFTTRPGYVGAGGGQGLPRVSLNGLYQNPAAVEALLAPGLWKLRDSVRRSA